jgi:hypothetical protein
MKYLFYFCTLASCVILILQCDVKLPQDEESFEYNEGLTVYSGQTNQDELIWFVMDKDVLKELHFTYKREMGNRSWGSANDTLSIIINNKFEYNRDNEFIITGGKIADEKFAGTWQLLYPSVVNGNWDAEKTKSLFIRFPHEKTINEITLTVGDSAFFDIECGVRPYHIIVPADSSIAKISNFIYTFGHFMVTGIAVGETSITFSDSSYPEKLEGKLDIKVVN